MVVKQDRVSVLSALSQAMRDSDSYCCKIQYRDKWGEHTERTISPIRFVKQIAVMALCCGREDVRRFEIDRIFSAELIRSEEVLMPEPIKSRQS